MNMNWQNRTAYWDTKQPSEIKRGYSLFQYMPFCNVKRPVFRLQNRLFGNSKQPISQITDTQGITSPCHHDALEGNFRHQTQPSHWQAPYRGKWPAPRQAALSHHRNGLKNVRVSVCLPLRHELPWLPLKPWSGNT